MARDIAERRNLGFGGDARDEKTVQNREDAPIFDVVVELDDKDHNKFRIVRDVAKAVDSILKKEKYQVEVRRRHMVEVDEEEEQKEEGGVSPTGDGDGDETASTKKPKCTMSFEFVDC